MRLPKRIYWVHLGPLQVDPEQPRWRQGLRYSERGGGTYTIRGHAENKVESLRRRGYTEARLLVADLEWKDVD